MCKFRTETKLAPVKEAEPQNKGEDMFVTAALLNPDTEAWPGKYTVLTQ